MSSIEEERNKTIAERIHQMAGTEPEVTATEKVRVNKKPKEKNHQSGDVMDIESYMKTFFSIGFLENRVSFSLSRETLELLRHILYELESKTTLSQYVENILRDHILKHKDVINKEIERNRRKPKTI